MSLYNQASPDAMASNAALESQQMAARLTRTQALITQMNLENTQRAQTRQQTDDASRARLGIGATASPLIPTWAYSAVADLNKIIELDVRLGASSSQFPVKPILTSTGAMLVLPIAINVPYPAAENLTSVTATLNSLLAELRNSIGRVT